MIRVLVVADHFVVRKGVCALLAGAGDIVVVGEAGDGLQAVVEAGRCVDPALPDEQMLTPCATEGLERVTGVSVTAACVPPVVMEVASNGAYIAPIAA